MWIRIVFLTLFISQIDCYKILALFAHPGKSHVDVFYPLTKALAQKGHQVTVVSHYPPPKSIPNYEHVQLGIPWTGVVPMENITHDRMSRWLEPLLLHKYALLTCEENLKSQDFQNFLKKEEKFDVVIVEFFNSNCFLGVVHKFQAPMVGISSCLIYHWMNGRLANPDNPSYIPNTMMVFSTKMSFFERLENFVVGVLQNLFFEEVTARSEDLLVEKFLGKGIPKGEVIAKNCSLLLVNSHFSLAFPRPLVPGVVEVGGLHVGEVKKVPENLEKWINESAHGVIYFSLGSMIKGHTFPEEKRQEFLRAFGRLPQRVLWKYENDTMPGKPDNVMIQKWMPQLDILCHPNVKAFISHGGLLGTTEAVHCGVPVMVMPQYGDQFTNAKALEANGGGVILHLQEATEEKVYEALTTILNPKFKKQAEDLSARFRDRPLPPLETAIYWVEYVARHKGAHHMRTAAVGMPLYKYLLLDVIAFLLIVAGLVCALSYYVTRTIFRKLFGRKDKVKTN